MYKLLLALATFACGSEHTTKELPRFVNLPVSRDLPPTFGDAESSRLLSRRGDSNIDLALLNNKSFYSINLELGTPPQFVSLLLDTGSSDLWVFDESSCGTTSYSQCPAQSYFNPRDSSTLRRNHTSFVSSYADSSSSSGEWVQDTAQIGGNKISNLNFAVADSAGARHAVAGIGLPSHEAPYMLEDIEEPYLNLPLQLKQQGFIQHAAYSLWLNQNGSDAGSILFGAVDHTKYHDDLYRVPLVLSDRYDVVSEFAVKLTGLSIYDSKGNEQPFASCEVPAVLDTGATLSTFSWDLIKPFYNTLNLITYQGLEITECSSLTSEDGGIGFQFGGIDVTVGFSDLFVKVAHNTETGEEYCVPGFQISDDYCIIGDNVLRSLYVVYDLENLEVGIAAANLGNSVASTSSIELISTGIPGRQVQLSNDTSLRSLRGSTHITLFTTPEDTSSSSGYFSVAVPKTTDSEVYSSRAIAVPSSVRESIQIGAKSALGKSEPTATGHSQKGTQSSVSGSTLNSKSKSESSRSSASSSPDAQASQTGQSTRVTSQTGQGAQSTRGKATTSSSDAATKSTGSLMAVAIGLLLLQL